MNGDKKIVSSFVHGPFPPQFCCPEMARMLLSGVAHVVRDDDDTDEYFAISVKPDDKYVPWIQPIKFCMFCGEDLTIVDACEQTSTSLPTETPGHVAP